jgi:hypothetical protein
MVIREEMKEMSSSGGSASQNDKSSANAKGSILLHVSNDIEEREEESMRANEIEAGGSGRFCNDVTDLTAAETEEY